jgi:hypothetical protein
VVVPLAAFPPVYYCVSYVEHHPAPLAWLLLLPAAFEVQGRFGGTGSAGGAGPAKKRNLSEL